MTENQKLREALSELMSIVSIHQKATGNNFAWAEMDFARETLALPTADHIPEAWEKVADHLPNAGKMINGLTQAETDASASVSGLTGAPVGEREAFGYFYIVNGVHEGFCKGVEPPPDDSYDEGTLVPVYRSALSAGDAVDAQRYRYHRAVGGQSWHEVSDPRNPKRITGALYDVATDEAMRKGQL